MNLRTTFPIDPSPYKITYDDGVMFIGSCFASSIGEHLSTGKMKVMINPAGTVFNPVSVCNTLDNITSEREFTKDDLHFNDGMWLSFFHYTDFSSEDPDKALLKINNRMKEAALFLKGTGFLFITLGTARVYKWKRSGLVVSNCHKIPASQFSSEMLSVNEIVDLWSCQLDRLSVSCPGLKVIFTISPVRHLKDGAHGNQISKSLLFLSVEELLKHPSRPLYFPAYELVMDDLRDYRFYNDDMIHPSASAINYIWEAFSGSYLDYDTIQLWNEATKISKALTHRLNTDSITRKNEFVQRMISRISQIEKKLPSINFSEERNYFLNL